MISLIIQLENSLYRLSMVMSIKGEVYNHAKNTYTYLIIVYVSICKEVLWNIFLILQKI